jgi:hypothetical protein
MTPADIYKRHLDAVMQEQPGRRADVSRVDAQVAVRMRVAGHSREQITDAIKVGASGERPDEKRDWDRYARCATQFAFSRPGLEKRDRLAGQRQRFIRHEGSERDINLGRGRGDPMKNL